MTTRSTKQPRKSGVHNTELLSVRITKGVANVLKADASSHGRGVADHHRAILDFNVTLSALAHVREAKTRQRIKAKGSKPAEYEAALLDRLRAQFLAIYGRELPRDVYDLISEVQSD